MTQPIEPVASVFITKFRRHLENFEFDYWADLPEGTHQLYTAAALEAAKQEGRREGLEDAAKVCDERYFESAYLEDEPKRCAEAIRALIEKEKE